MAYVKQDEAPEVHYVVHVKVEEVTRKVKKHSGGPMQAAHDETVREVEQLMVVTTKGNTKDAALEKAKALLDVEGVS